MAALTPASTDIVLGVSYVNQEPVLASDREISLFPTPGATSCNRRPLEAC